MKSSTIKSTNSTLYMEEFNSISELVNTINSRNYNPKITSRDSIEKEKSFSGTKSYKEAEDLLLHGWTEESEKLNNLLKLKVSNVKQTKTTYDVAGFQCSVPRYLQGIPTSMINQKIVTKKQKNIIITKFVAYSGYVKKETIENESVKVLQLVNSLEKQGYRVTLNVLLGSYKKDTALAMKVRIKNSSERLNLSKVSFPLVHPSFLRRICFKWIETNEHATKSFNHGYGVPLGIEGFKKFATNSKNSNEYYAGQIFDNETITIDDLYH